MDKVIQLYQYGYSGLEISNLTGISKSQIYRMLHKSHIHVRSNKENYKIYLKRDFSHIQSELESWLLGILITDGQIQQPHQSSMICRLDLLKEDEVVLEYLQNYLGIENRIRYYHISGSDKQVARIVIPSDKLCANLSQWGVVQNKTFITTMPKISPKLYPHFIRGCSDGDGSITTNHWKLIGTIDLLTSIQNILCQDLMFNKTKLQQRHKDRNNNIRSLEYGGNKQLAKLYQYLYKDSSYFLPRKQTKWYEKIKRYI